MHRLACLLLVLAACPPRPPQGGPQQPAPLVGAGCPKADGVFVASYLTQEPAKGRTGWVLPLHTQPIDGAAQVADYARLDDATAAASGVPAVPPGNMWLVTGTAPPCAIKLGAHYAAKIDAPASLSYGVEIDGCPPPADQDAGGVVLASVESPGACVFQSPQPVASRIGAMDAQQHWTTPEKATPIPPALVPVIPPHDCQAPGCEQLWSFSQVDASGTPVAWSGAVNWLAIGDPAHPCDWKAERWSGFFVPGPDGAPVKVIDGQDHPLVLSTVLVDRSGAYVLLAEGPGEYATYDLAPGKATLGHHVAWMGTPADAWDMVDHLGPICAPAP